MINDKWVVQIRKGLVELAVMMIIKNGKVYGYQITKSLKSDPILEVSDGSIYPILKRLESDKLVYATWEQPEHGLRRKYYELSEIGERILSERVEIFSQSMELLRSLQGGLNNEN